MCKCFISFKIETSSKRAASSSSVSFFLLTHLTAYVLSLLDRWYPIRTVEKAPDPSCRIEDKSRKTRCANKGERASEKITRRIWWEESGEQKESSHKIHTRTDTSARISALTSSDIQPGIACHQSTGRWKITSHVALSSISHPFFSLFRSVQIDCERFSGFAQWKEPSLTTPFNR